MRDGRGTGLDRAVGSGAVGLGGVVVLYELFTIGAGIAFQARQFPGDVLHRVGFVAASAIDLRIGVALVVAALCAAVAAHLDAARPRSETATGTGTGLPPLVTSAATPAAGAIVLVGCGIAVVLAVLALRAQYHQLDLRKTDATSAFHLSQATYLVGAVAPAVVAAVVVVRGVLAGSDRR
jgi:hypothetical protein